MKNKYILSLFLFLTLNHLLIAQEKKNSLFFENIIDKINDLDYLNRKEEVIGLCRIIIDRRKNKNELANDYYRLGYYFKKDHQIDSTYNYYLKSYQIYSSLNDSLNVAKQLFKISKLESDQELYNKSDSSAVSALKYLKKENKLYSSIYNCLAVNSRHKKEFNEALKWYDFAIKTSLDSIKKLRYLNNKAIVFFDLKKYNIAITNYEEIIKTNYYDSIPLKLKAKIIDNYAFTKFLDDQNIDETEFLEAQSIKIDIKDDYGLIANYAHLSEFHKKKNTSKSLEYAYKMYNLSKSMVLPKDRIEALDKIISLENTIKVRKFAEERNRISDSLQLAKQRSQNKFAKIIYNYEEEEKQKLKAQVALEKQKAQKTQLIYLSILVLILFMIYLFYKHQKAKKEKVIQVYKTETRLSKKMHDEVANEMYVVMIKAQDPNNQNRSLLPDLEKIYALTRDISHENNIIITGKEFKNYLEELFVQFFNNNCKILTKGLSNSSIPLISKEKQIVIYRVLQELLVNMKKHSKASLVMINFSEIKNTIFVNYKDNGIGTSSLEIKNGLQNMETRNWYH